MVHTRLVSSMVSAIFDEVTLVFHIVVVGLGKNWEIPASLSPTTFLIVLHKPGREKSLLNSLNHKILSLHLQYMAAKNK